MDQEIVHELIDTSEGLLNTSLFEIAGTPISTTTVVLFVFIVFLTFWISRLLRRGVLRGLRARGVTDMGTTELVSRMAHYSVLAMGLGVALQTVGIDLGALFAAGAVFAVGIGFAMQNIAQNFVSGLILLVERSIRPGDTLRVGGEVVQVQVMGIRSTVVRTRDGDAVIVPNSGLVANEVHNYTLESTIFRIHVGVGVTYDSDMRLTKQVLEQALEAAPFRLEERPVRVLMVGFGDNSVNFDTSLWIDDPWEQRQFISDLHELIWFALKDAGIVIAFPQLDVHFDSPVAEGFARIRSAS